MKQQTYHNEPTEVGDVGGEQSIQTTKAPSTSQSEAE